jgi:hypothetical protein
MIQGHVISMVLEKIDNRDFRSTSTKSRHSRLIESINLISFRIRYKSK